jgi:Tfp pilus assembly PilM family ATPase
MDKERILRGSLLTVTRRFSAGIDVSEDAVRLVVLSRRLRANAAVCVEHLVSVPLPESAVVSGDIVDRNAIANALRDAFDQLPARGAWRTLRCAMGLSSIATHTLSVPLAQLMEPRETRLTLAGSDPLGVLEPAVLAEAERATGIERGALAVDWSVHVRDDGQKDVVIAATQRRHVEACMETTAAAGIALAAIDGEPAAALRAMRHTGETELDADARYVVCWLERGGLHAWLVEAGEVTGEVRFPAPEHRSVAEALRDLAGGHARIDCIYVGGDTELMTQAGLSLPGLSKRFECAALPFECAPFCNGSKEIDATLKHSPRFAVAFGLALREMTQ